MASQTSPQNRPPTDWKPRLHIRLHDLSISPISIITYLMVSTFTIVLQAIVRLVNMSLGAAVALKSGVIEKQKQWSELKGRQAFEQQITEESALLESYNQYLEQAKVKYAQNPFFLQQAEQFAQAAYQEGLEHLRMPKPAWFSRWWRK